MKEDKRTQKEARIGQTGKILILLDCDKLGTSTLVNDFELLKKLETYTYYMT